MAQPKRVNSLIRGLEILESFSPGQARLTLQELSGRTGLPKTTVHRFMKTLLNMNYVTLNQETKTYALAPRVMSLGFSVLAGLGLREAAFPFMEALSKDSEQNVHLAILDRTEMVYIEKITIHQIINTSLHVGSRVSCYQTAMGRAFIAFLSPEKYEKLITELLKNAEHARQIGQKGEFINAILEETRQRGYSINDNEWVPGLRAIGAPIFDNRGEVAAAVNMSFFSHTVSVEDMVKRYLPRLLETSSKISTVLGFNGLPRFHR